MSCGRKRKAPSKSGLGCEAKVRFFRLSAVASVTIVFAIALCLILGLVGLTGAPLLVALALTLAPLLMVGWLLPTCVACRCGPVLSHVMLRMKRLLRLAVTVLYLSPASREVPVSEAIVSASSPATAARQMGQTRSMAVRDDREIPTAALFFTWRRLRAPYGHPQLARLPAVGSRTLSDEASMNRETEEMLCSIQAQLFAHRVALSTLARTHPDPAGLLKAWREALVEAASTSPVMPA